MLRQLHSVQLTSNFDYACRRVRVEAQLSRRTLSLRKKWIFTAVPAACLRIEMIVPAALTLLRKSTIFLPYYLQTYRHEKTSPVSVKAFRA